MYFEIRAKACNLVLAFLHSLERCSLKVSLLLIKHGSHLTFNTIRVLKKIVLTFCLHKILIKCRVSIRKSLNITEKIRTRKIPKAEGEGIKIENEK